MEKHIKVSTQGRLTIPKQIRDSLRIADGQPVVIRTNSAKKEIILQLQPTMSDYK
ncbi:MAG: AbrB/MazE/SpoVT family DNA-binding domain-containing protein [Nitrososphaerales archaeon]